MKAAQFLFITQSAVSQRIQSLEKIIGQPLLIRSPEIKPTKIGQELLSHFSQVSLLEKMVTKRWSKKGSVEFPYPLAVAINTETLSTWFIEAVRPILKKWHIVLEILAEDQDKTIDFLRAGKVWGCVTSVKAPPYGCVSTFIGNMGYHCVATPSFNRHHFSKGVDGKSLLHAPAVVYGDHDDMHKNYLKSHYKKYSDGQPIAHHVPSSQGIIQFALESLGYALLPEISISDYLKKNVLVKLIPDKPFYLPLYWQTQELQTEVTVDMSKQIIRHASKVLSLH